MPFLPFRKMFKASLFASLRTVRWEGVQFPERPRPGRLAARGRRDVCGSLRGPHSLRVAVIGAALAEGSDRRIVPVATTPPPRHPAVSEQPQLPASLHPGVPRLHPTTQVT
jgi:hypothetical protein